MSRPLLLVLGDHLSHDLPILRDAPREAVVALCEVAEEGRYVPHHPQKIALILAAMRHFAEELRTRGWRVHYSALDAPDNPQTLVDEAFLAGLVTEPAYGQGAHRAGYGTENAGDA